MVRCVRLVFDFQLGWQVDRDGTVDGHFVRANGTRGRINEIGFDVLLEQCVVPDDVE